VFDSDAPIDQRVGGAAHYVVAVPATVRLRREQEKALVVRRGTAMADAGACFRALRAQQIGG
jgi:hypothetical protein